MEHVFASEASGKLGVHQKNMMMLNCKPPPQVIYDDVLVLCPSYCMAAWFIDHCDSLQPQPSVFLCPC